MGATAGPADRRIGGMVVGGGLVLAGVLGLVLLTAPLTAAAEPDGPQFTLTGELFNENGHGSEYGISIAIDGDTMVVGAREGDQYRFGDCGRGRAYVYARSGTLDWELVARLDPSGPAPCGPEYFGQSVAISGDWIAVGAPWDTNGDPNDYSHGTVRLYQKPAGGWQDAVETTTLSFEDDDPYVEAFGMTVALDGNTLAVGASRWTDSAPNEGAVFVYRNTLDAWDQVAKLASPDPWPSGQFGASLAISGGTIAVGTYSWYYGRVLDAGAAYIFEEPVAGWADTDTADAVVATPGAFAYSVALDGDTLAIAEPQVQRAFVYTRPVGGWVSGLEPSAELISGVGPKAFDTAAIEGDVIVLGAMMADDEAGEAYVFRRPADGWGTPGDEAQVTAVQRLQHPDPTQGAGTFTGDMFGLGLAIDSDTLVAGASRRDHFQDDTQQMNYDAGSAYVFKLSSDSMAPVTTITREPSATSGQRGWDTAAITLSVAATDVGSGVEQTRCQLDPVVPVSRFDELPAGSCPYVGGGTVATAGIHTLYAASRDMSGNQGAVAMLAMKIDSTPPTAAIDLSPAEPDGPDGAWLGPLDVYLRAFDEASGSALYTAWCTLDPAVAPSTYQELATMPWCGNDFWTGTGRRYTSDGEHTIWVAGMDTAGNVSAPISRTFQISAAPLVTLALAPAAPDGSDDWYRVPVRVTVAGTLPSGQPAAATRCVLDPATPPASFADIPGTCPYLGAGALVNPDGEHVVYAASQDAAGVTGAVRSVAFKIDATAPRLTCDGTGPALFTVGEAEGTITATVDDAASGPSSDSASVTLADTDLDSVGAFTVSVSATDVAGNQGSVGCAYLVGYDLAIVDPTPGAAFKAGATVALAFQLLDASGEAIPDAVATTLLGGRKAPCRISVRLDDAALRGCPTYASSTKLFSFSVKTPKSRSAIGTHDIAVEVRASDNKTVISLQRVVIQLTS